MSIAKFIKSIAAYYAILLLFMVMVRYPLFLAINWHHGDTLITLQAIFDSVVAGLPLDLAATSYLCILPWLVFIIRMYTRRPSLRVLMIVYNTILAVLIPLIIVANASMFFFWDTPLDASALLFLRNPATAAASVSFGYLLGRFFTCVALGIVLYQLLRWSVRPWKPGTTLPCSAKWISLSALSAIMSGGLIFAGLRGLDICPTTPAKAYLSKQMYYNHMAVNPVFNMMFSITHNNQLAKMYHSFPENERAEIVKCMLPHKEGTTQKLLKTDRPDILLIIVESLAAPTMPSLSPGNELAVCTGLDSLARESIFFSRCYGDSYQTDQATPCILNGYHTLSATRPLRNEYKMRQMPSIPMKLKNAGYRNSFVYGGDINYMNMYSYVRYTGYDNICTYLDYPKEEYMCRWGIPDHIMFDHLYDEMTREKRDSAGPEFYTLLTISSHKPHDVPNFKRYDNPMANSYAYVDSCMTAFINRIRKTPIWNNLLVIIIGDHGPHEFVKTKPEYGHIVFMMLGGAVAQPRRIDTIMNQHDLAATLLGQLGLDHEEFKLSRDVLSDSYTYPVAINSFNDGFTIIDDSGALIFDNVSKQVILGNDQRLLRLGKAFQQTSAEYFESLTPL